MRCRPPLPSATNTRRSPGRRSGSRKPSTSQRRRPPSNMAWAIARSRCVRSAARKASASAGSSTRGSVRGARIKGTPRTPGRLRRPRVARPRGTGLVATPAIAPGHEIVEQPGHAGQSTLDGTGGQARLAVLQPHHPGAAARSALGLDEPQHVRGGDLGRLLHHLGEENLEVIGRGQERIRTSPRGDEFEIVVEQRMTERDGPKLVARHRLDQAGSITDKRGLRSRGPTPANGGGSTVKITLIS